MSNGGFGPDPFGGAPFGHNPFGAPPPTVAAPPPPPPDEPNTPATLSVVFAFLFAPAGAVLGHLGLARAHRTGGGGRDKALVGLTLSYAVIVVVVVALVVWGVTSQREPAATVVATPSATAAPSPTQVSSSTTTTTTPPPRIEPAGLEALVLPLDEIRAITNNPALAPEATYTAPTTSDNSRYDPPECVVSMFTGATEIYQGLGYRGFYAVTAADPGVNTHVAQTVAVFDDAAAAQNALAAYQQRWRDCAGKRLKWTWVADGDTTMFTLGSPQPAPGPMTVMTNTNDGTGTLITRALTAKANVLVDIEVLGNGADQNQTITNRIMQKIPG